MALIDKLTAIADAVREKTGGTDALTLEQMVTEIEGIEAGGGNTEELIPILDGTLTSFTAPEALTKVKDYLFYSSNLVTVDLSKCSCHIEQYAFASCKSLEGVILPDWSKATSNHMPFGSRAFQNCSSLKTTTSPYQFMITSGSQGVFQNCTSLEQAIFPNGWFNNAGNVFSGCSSLKLVDIGWGKIAGSMFTNCSELRTLIIRFDRGASELASVGGFSGTPFASGGTGGTVYVPSALIESYKTATNWSTLYTAGTCNFVAIEGSEYE